MILKFWLILLFWLGCSTPGSWLSKAEFELESVSFNAKRSVGSYLREGKSFVQWCEKQNCTDYEKGGKFDFRKALIAGAVSSYFLALHGRGVVSITQRCCLLKGWLSGVWGYRMSDSTEASVKKLGSTVKKYHRVKKAAVFGWNHLESFYERTDMNDREALLKQVYMGISMSVMMRFEEHHKLTFEQCWIDSSGTLHIALPQRKTTNQDSELTIVSNPNEKNCIVTRFVHLQSMYLTDSIGATGRIYKKVMSGSGKFGNAPLGEHKVRSWFKEIASFLGLEHPERYTTHSGRRSGASRLAQQGANAAQIMTAGGWSNMQAAKLYVEQSPSSKTAISRLIQGIPQHPTNSTTKSRLKSSLSTPTVSHPTLSTPTLSKSRLSKPTLSDPTLSKPILSKPTPSTANPEPQPFNLPTNKFGQTIQCNDVGAPRPHHDRHGNLLFSPPTEGFVKFYQTEFPSMFPSPNHHRRLPTKRKLFVQRRPQQCLAPSIQSQNSEEEMKMDPLSNMAINAATYHTLTHNKENLKNTSNGSIAEITTPTRNQRRRLDSSLNFNNVSNMSVNYFYNASPGGLNTLSQSTHSQNTNSNDRTLHDGDD